MTIHDRIAGGDPEQRHMAECNIRATLPGGNAGPRPTLPPGGRIVPVPRRTPGMGATILAMTATAGGAHPGSGASLRTRSDR